MKLVYISGPYRAKTIYGVHQNIEAARKVAINYWQLGYAVICPHLNTAFFDGSCVDNVWLDGDIEILSRCDVVVMMKGWGLSEGARKEYKVALKLQKEIIYEEDLE